MLGIRSRTLKGPRRLAALWHARSELERMAATHHGHVVNKWQHDRHFARLRERDITLVEIGVAGGGSLELWRRYFGPRARIVGVDVNPECKRFESPGTRVILGDQGDPAFLATLAADVGPIDILIDDGSHAFAHQLTTFRSLFPHIRADGIYCCEDLHTSYETDVFHGGVRQPGTYVEFLKELIDEMNAWFWRQGVEQESGAIATCVHGIHFYPTLVVIEKRLMPPPLITPVGRTRSVAKPTGAARSS